MTLREVLGSTITGRKFETDFTIGTLRPRQVIPPVPNQRNTETTTSASSSCGAG
jgi:hypothetical protein